MSSCRNTLNISCSTKKLLLINPETGKILDASEEALAFYGWTLPEISSMSIYEINTMAKDEIQDEMKAAVLSKRNYFRFRHITKSGEIKRVNVTALPIRLDGHDILLSIVENPSEVKTDHLDDIKDICEFSADPLVVLKTTSDTGREMIVYTNAAGRSFLGSDAVGSPISNNILIYDRSNFEAALNRVMGEYYFETDILFKTRHETMLKSVGMSRLFYNSDYYVLMQIRSPKSLRISRIRKNELAAELDLAIEKNFKERPEEGFFGILCLNEMDILKRTLGKEEYLKMLLSAGKTLKPLLGETGDYELLDESVLFFYSGLVLRDEGFQGVLSTINEGYRNFSELSEARIQCVSVSYQGEKHNQDFGLSPKMISALDNSEVYTRIKLITEKDIRKSRLIEDLKSAAGTNELFLLYQPIVDIVRGEIVSLEALVRWNHPLLGIIEPSEFISLAEAQNLITCIDEWVLDEVLSQPRDYPVHVNLSTQDLLDDRFRGKIVAILRDNPDKVIIELTETTNFELSEGISEELNAVNAKLSIDDFGTGYSSMARLTSLDVSSLKIDQSFVMNSGNDVESASICIAIIRLGKGLNIEVIAEGAETLEQIRFLYRSGCRLIQGYGVSKPIPYEAIKYLDVSQFKMGSEDKYGFDSQSGTSRVDFSTAMVLEMDEHNNFIRVPMSFCRFTGYSQSELKQMTILDLVPEDEREICKANCRTLKEKGYVENVVFYIQSADGSRKCVSAIGKKGTGGDLSTYLYLEQNDMEEEKIMDIQGAQGAYSTLFHEGPLATVVWRQDFEIIDWNQEAEATFGWSRDEAMGCNMLKLLVRKSTFPDYMNVVNNIMTESSYDSVNYNVTRTGKQIICRWTNRVVKDRHGNVQFFISMAKDITEDLVKNDRIKQLSSAVEKSGSGVVVTDDTGRILSVNNCYMEMTGYSDSELVGRNIDMLSGQELSREIYDELWDTIRDGRVWEGEFHNKRKDGSLYWCKTTIVPVISEWTNTVNYLGIQKDLTAEKEQEETSGAIRARLIEQERLATLGSMMAGVTHETYNFMAYAESNLEYTRSLAEKSLEGQKIDPEDLLHAVEDAQEGVARIKEMLHSLKMASRKDVKPNKETCEINKEILMVASLVKNEYKYHSTLEFQPGEEIVHLGYPGLLRQVIMNILLNAAHAIKARNVQALGKITIHAQKQNGWVKIVIQDNGIGMDKSTMEQIFEPFYTTKKSGEGTGLGLSISKGIIEDQYGGSLTCESEVGVGSTFVIDVPDIV